MSTDGFHILLSHVEREKYRVERDSGSAALFLLVGKARYRRIVEAFNDSPMASTVRRYTPAHLDIVGDIESVIGLAIVIDQRNDLRMDVVGRAGWEAW